jgi:hypothetical protein
VPTKANREVSAAHFASRVWLPADVCCARGGVGKDGAVATTGRDGRLGKLIVMDGREVAGVEDGTSERVGLTGEAAGVRYAGGCGAGSGGGRALSRMCQHKKFGK